MVTPSLIPLPPQPAVTADTPDEEAVNILTRRITDFVPRVALLDGYYEGAKRLEAMGLALPPEMEPLQTIVNWPAMYLDALEERLDVEGFRLAGQTGTDERLWEWWQANDLDEESGLGHLDSMIFSRSFAVVGPGDSPSDAPVITVESPESMAADVDPRTRRVRAALRLYDDNELGRPQKATLYRPVRTVYYELDSAGKWVVADVDDHEYGTAQVVPLINRARLGRCHRDGVTEMRDIIDITNAGCRALTDLQAAQELLALPQRFVLGASETDFTDADGNQIPTWEAYIGRLWTLQNQEAKVGQLQAADLRNFTEVLTLYSRLASGLTGLPPHYFGLIADNPASADAIRAGETRLVKKAERKQRSFGADWERVMRLAMLVAGEDPSQARRLETVWRDAATPTYAAKADAVTKLFTAGLLPKEAAWEDLGYSAERRRRLRDLDADDPAQRFLASLDDTSPRLDRQPVE